MILELSYKDSKDGLYYTFLPCRSFVFQQWLLEFEIHKNIVRVEIPKEEDGRTPKKEVFPKSITLQRPTVPFT